MEEDKKVARYLLAIILTPILITIFVWLEEIAKGSELHYWGGTILNRFFVEIMFAAFIPLALGTFLLLFSRFEEAPRLLRFILYAITILSLISTLFMANSLATVPRGGKQSSFGFSTGTFAGNITRLSTGEYCGENYQIVFTNDCPTSMVVASSSPTFELGVRLQTTKPVNLNGTLYLFMELHRFTEGLRLSRALYYSLSQTSINLEGSSLWTGKIATTEIRWGSDNEHERMRLEGYKIVFRLRLGLSGVDQGKVISFTADVPGSFYLIDFRVDSSLQNGVAILLCGIFAGIHVQILGKSVIKRIVRARSIRSL